MSRLKQQKIAIILFNLGGPNTLADVRPFLYNLFNDSAIIPFSQPLRWLFAKTISNLRHKKSEAIYEKIGGGSPLLSNTLAQAEALNNSLSDFFTVKTWAVMRYWHPMASDIKEDLINFAPDQVVLLPLYPHYSITTTASSLREWQNLYNFPNTKIIFSYHTHKDFILAHEKMLTPWISQAATQGVVKVLFSAHGIPQRCVDNGDPYQWQIEASVQAIMANFPDVAYQVCYQSKVGKTKWLEPSLEQAIFQSRNHSLVIVPIAFVSEHSETLVELDIDFAAKAKLLNVPFYGRVPALGCQADFINCLRNLVLEAVN